MIRQRKLLKNIISFLFLVCSFFIAGNVFAQGLNLAPAGTEDFLTEENKQILLIGTRFVLVFILLIAGLFGLIAGRNWIYWEGNAIKAKDSKIKLAKALIVISIVFFLLVLYKVFIPDYSLLTL